MIARKARVNRVINLSDRVKVYYLEGVDIELPQFEPGAHIEVVLPSGLRRNYSLINKYRAGGDYVIAVQVEHTGRGGSIELFQRVCVGSVIEIIGPRNKFRLVGDASHYYLLAGGIGITPLLAMAGDLWDSGESFSLYYFCRDRNSAAFGEILRKSRFSSRVSISYDEEDRVDIADIIRRAGENSRFYVCGPAGFMDYCLELARDFGHDEDRLHKEHFKSNSASVVAGVMDREFELVVGNVGVSVIVAGDESAVEALRRVGIAIPVSCEQGVCSTCLTRVVDGIPEHRDLFMSDEEHDANDKFTPCVSRSHSDRLIVEVPMDFVQGTG